jgi:tetratricopeptide (TPR) repeat protein
MVRALATLFVVGCFTLGVVRTAEAQRPTIEALYDEWLGGDYRALPAAFPDARAFSDARDDLRQTLRRWVRAFKPSQGAFLLELSLLGFERQWPEAAELLGGTRDMMVNRVPGTRPADDRVELLFHRAAVTFFLGRQLLAPAEAYLNALAGRVDLRPSTTGTPRLTDPWMTLARAMLNDIAIAPASRLAGGAGAGVRTFLVDSRDTAGRRQAQLALIEYERLRSDPDLGAEASVRRALLLVRLGEPAAALVALDEADRLGADETVRYFGELFRGRALEQLGQSAEAIAAYTRASTRMPSAQAPMIALASLLYRTDQPDEALRWTARVTTVPLADPWWLYWRGDFRHSAARLDALRRARP